MKARISRIRLILSSFASSVSETYHLETENCNIIVVKVHRSYHTTSLVNQSLFIRISYKNRKEKKIISLVLACEEEDQRTLSENLSGKTNFMFK